MDQNSSRALYLWRKKRRKKLTLDTFHISKYPITNAQYQTFIDDGGYEEKQWWQELKKPTPEASEWPQANRPKTNIDAYEAIAFCRWLSARLGYPIRLPTVEE